jgi:fused signal recognition particle receptor
VFKRLRDGLFKRQDDEQDELEATEAPTLTDEAMAPADVAAPDGQAVEAPGEAPAEPDESVGSATTLEPPVEPPPGNVVSVADEESDAEASPEASGQRRGLFNPFKLTLGRTRQLFGRVNESLAHEEITEDLWDELEETLISSDVGVQTTERLTNILRERVAAEHMTRGSELRAALKVELELLLGDPEPLIFSESSAITVLLFVGVNGVGKTTSIAKLANLLKKQKHRVMLAAGDTFRAAAVEQLKTWGERVGVPVIAHQQGVDPKSVADPAAVVYDAMQAAQARGTDVLIVDTAGRLHTKVNLMDELKKIVRVLQKYDPEAPHEVLLVLDATTGQNGLAQAKQFVQDSGVSGVVLTKLDGTARGGIVFAIASELGLPIKFIGTGERVGDIAPFNVEQFINALFDED